MGVGMRLKLYLHSKGMTIKELSKLSGVSVHTLYSITKRDSLRIDSVILQKISDALGVPTEYLQFPQWESHGDPDNSKFTDENAEKQLAKLHQYGEMAKELDRMNGHFEYSEEQIKWLLSQMTIDELLDLLGMVTEEVKKQTNGEESK